MTTEASILTHHQTSHLNTSPNTEPFVHMDSKVYKPIVRSGHWSDIGPRSRNEDQAVQFDDLSAAACVQTPSPTALYALFDGHGGCDASAYLKNHVMELFLGGSDDHQEFLNLLATDNYLGQEEESLFVEELKGFHRETFLHVDEALLSKESKVDEYCGSTALTALVTGRHLMVANAGDSRAVLCRKEGVSVQLTRDHRPNCIEELERIKGCGGYVEDGYLNGEIAVSRSLGDRYMKTSKSSPLISEPDVFHIELTEEDEFLIMACDGLWDVVRNEEAVRVVRSELEKHGDPEMSAKALVKCALDRDTADNVTVIVVCLREAKATEPHQPEQRRRFRFCGMSAEAKLKLQSLLEGN